MLESLSPTSQDPVPSRKRHLPGSQMGSFQGLVSGLMHQKGPCFRVTVPGSLRQTISTSGGAAEVVAPPPPCKLFQEGQNILL